MLALTLEAIAFNNSERDLAHALSLLVVPLLSLLLIIPLLVSLLLLVLSGAIGAKRRMEGYNNNKGEKERVEADEDAMDRALPLPGSALEACTTYM